MKAMSSMETIPFSFLPPLLQSETGMNQLDRFMPCGARATESDCGIRNFQAPDCFGGETYVELVSAVILGFSQQQQQQTGGPCAEQRTSYGLYNRAFCRMPGLNNPLARGCAPLTP